MSDVIKINDVSVFQLVLMEIFNLSSVCVFVNL